jgi:hypothetical protein
VTTLRIPAGLEFAKLRLELDDAGGLHYAADVLAAFCWAMRATSEQHSATKRPRAR